MRSERRLCEEVDPNLAFRWFCRRGLDGRVPDHSSFSENRHGRFRDSGIMRELFERIVERCFVMGLAGTSVVAAPDLPGTVRQAPTAISLTDPGSAVSTKHGKRVFAYGRERR